jgi:DNA-binding MarR family transcriptional regulator
MNDWSDEIHAVLLRLNGYMNRPDLDRAFLERAGVKLDRALFPLLTRIGNAHPVSVGELAYLVGRDHSVVSRQVAKLEGLGLVSRQADDRDQRVRLLEPSRAGWTMLNEFAKARRQLLNERLAAWTGDDRSRFLTLLRDLSEAIAGFGGAFNPERQP